MSCKKIITFLIIVFSGLSVSSVEAQELNIRGDTIFVNVEAEIQIKFPTIPVSFNTVPTNAPYSLRSEKTSVIITGKLENSKPASLLVSEGGRTHHFNLIFKKDIDYNNEPELFKDYGTEKKLKQHILETASRKSVAVTPEKEGVKPQETSVVPADNGNSVQQENDKKYAAIIGDAKTYLDQQKYQQATDAYNQALAIKPGDLFATRQLEIITSIVSAEKMRKEQQKSADSYNEYIAQGEKAFNKNQLVEARVAYAGALVVRPNDVLATSRLKSIDEKEQRQRESEELEKKYSSSIQTADELYKAGDLEGARAEYVKALGLFKRPVPQDQIKKIDKQLASKAAQENAEKLKLAHEAEITSRYMSLIKDADTEFDKTNYTKAQKIYVEASNLKPSEEHPKERLDIIKNILVNNALELKAKNDSIALAKETNRKYNQALSQGKSSYDKNDLLSAKVFYETAMNVKPTEEEPKNQLQIINKKLADIEREKEINNRYNRLVVSSDSLLAKKAYDAAISLYNEASNLKPSEPYPKAQIKFIQSEVAENERRKEIIKRQERELRYNKAIIIADKAVTDKRYEDARSAYIDALGIHPENEYAQRRLEIVCYQAERAKADQVTQAPVKADDNTTAVIKKKGKAKNENAAADKEQVKPADNHLALQSSPIPYSDEELKKKYPGIDFSALPPEQPFNKLAVSSKENLHIYDTLLMEKPRLDFSSSDQGIKLNIEGINFEETTAYVKVLIQNNSNADFLTGAMMLTWTRKTGNHIKLYPNHLFPSPLPVIKPANEAVVIYVCKTYDVLDAETLTFELIDRFKKVKLQVNIPGSAYNQEWVRYQ